MSQHLESKFSFDLFSSQGKLLVIDAISGLENGFLTCALPGLVSESRTSRELNCEWQLTGMSHL